MNSNLVNQHEYYIYSNHSIYNIFLLLQLFSQ